MLFEALAIGCLVAVLRRAGQPPARVLLYAWNPLAAWCFAGNGHVDAAAIGLVGLALLLRVQGHDGWCGFLGAYSGEEGLADGRGIWILAGLWHLDLHSPVVVRGFLLLATLFLGLLALAAGLVRREDTPAGDIAALGARAGCLVAAAFLVLSPHYPWYFPWLGLFAVLAPARSVLWLSVAPLALYLDPFGEFFVWPSAVYVPGLLLALVDLRRGPLPFGTVSAPIVISTRSLPA